MHDVSACFGYICVEIISEVPTAIISLDRHWEQLVYRRKAYRNTRIVMSRYNLVEIIIEIKMTENICLDIP